MADQVDLQRLVVSLQMQLKDYQQGVNKALGISQRNARQIQNTYSQMGRNLDRIGRSAASGLIGPLTGIGAALTTREILRYADAWTNARNSLAVAGVVGQEQKTILDQLFTSAQRNSTPIAALTGLYGKAAQASDNLGASQQDLLRFSDGVSVALRVAGVSAETASGALTQLGQLLGSARVQAEEFNSVNEGARPILIAVANGLDKAGGSVNKLKQLVNAGEVSGRQFFEAFLKGLPTIQAMAANATQTIDQGLTRVNNAFTRYIGETDESLGATQRLVQGLNLLADNFNTTADLALKLAGVIAAALVGRSIAGMVASLGVAIGTFGRFLAALRAASVVGGLSAAFAGLGVSAGPIGAIIGVIGASLYLFAGRSREASVGAQVYEESLKSLETQAENTNSAITRLSQTQRLQAGIDHAKQVTADLVREFQGLVGLLDNATMREVVSEEQLAQLRQLSSDASTGKKGASELKEALDKLAQASGGRLAEILDPLIKDLGIAIGQTKSLGSTLRAVGVQQASNRSGSPTERAEANAPPAPLPPTKPDDISYAFLTGTPLDGKQPKAPSLNEYQQATKALEQRTKALQAETAAQASLNPLMNDYGFAVEKARVSHELLTAAEEAGIEITPTLKEKIDDLATGYANASVAAQQLAERQDKVRESAEDAIGTAKEFAQGFVSDMMNGVSAAEALGNALNRLADKLLDMAFTSLFDPKGGFGGFLGSLFSGLGGGAVKAATGGSIKGPGTSRSDSIPAMLSNGEFVVNSQQAKKFGPLLAAINSGRIKSLAQGGFAGVPRVSPARTSSSMVISPVYSIDARGSDITEDRFKSLLQENNKALLQTVKRNTYGWYEDHKYRRAV